MIARVVHAFITRVPDGPAIAFSRGEVITDRDTRLTPAVLARAERLGLIEVIGRSARQAPITKGGAACTAW